MTESDPSIPSVERIQREEVLNAYKRFAERGIRNPGDLNLSDPEVEEAHALFDRWQREINAGAQGDEEAMRRVNLAKTMVYVDAGFTDREYLEEVLHEWLSEDSQNAEKEPNNPERVETRRQIAEAMKKIKSLL